MEDDLDKALEEQDDRILDKYINARFGLWNTLLSINGMLISASAIVFFINPKSSKCISIFLLLFSTISLLLILVNYSIVKELYFELGSIQPEDMDDIKAVKEREKRAPKLYRRINLQEKLAEYTMVFSIILLFLLILF